jgi:hypothetical protein
MAVNSRREQLLVKVVAELNALASIGTVERIQPTGPSELENYAAPQLPLAVVLGALPTPNIKFSQRERNVDIVVSDLGVDIFAYALDNVTPDTTISTLADDIWAALLADITHGFKWVISTKVLPEPGAGIWHPYCGFNMRAIITYKHGKGGI